TVDQHALDKDSEAIDSLACEGALLADEIAHTASLTPFSRVHAAELQTRASNFEDALSTRPPTRPPTRRAPPRSRACTRPGSRRERRISRTRCRRPRRRPESGGRSVRR